MKLLLLQNFKQTFKTPIRKPTAAISLSRFVRFFERLEVDGPEIAAGVAGLEGLADLVPIVFHNSGATNSLQ